MFEHKKDQTPQPGKYEYQSFIGEGPKYTFREKYDEDGTRKEKRHKKASRKKSFPGPGTYNVREEFSGPRYTFSRKYRSKSSKYLKVPGVGTYNLRSDKSMEVPSYKFDQEKRINGSINKTALNNPGPGKYNLNSSGMSTIGPKYSFSATKRLEQKRASTPGPGAYSFKTYIGKEGPMLSFSKDKVGHLQPDKNTNPEPGKYFPNIKYIPSTAYYSIPKAGIESTRKSKSRFSSPGPEKYNPNPMLSSTRTSFPSWKIGTSKREMISDENNNPGPGQYDIKNGLLPQGAQYTMSAKLSTLNKTNKPGAGKYEAVLIQHPNEPKYSIGKEIRGDELKKIEKENFPGPGQYGIKDSELSKPFSFPKSRKDTKRSNNVPGPGRYKSPCRFNDISNVTRERGTWDPTFRYV